MYTALLIIHTLVALGLGAAVLLQSGRSAGLSGAITGGAEQLFGKKKGMDHILARISTVLAVAFMATSLALTVLARHR